MKFSTASELASRLKEKLNISSLHSSGMLKRASLHLGLGAVAVAIAITSSVPAFAGATAAKDTEKAADATPSDAVVIVEENEPLQIVYATDVWWKAGIDEYGLVEYTVTQVPEIQPEELLIKYPDISFTVTAADGAQAGEPTVYPHSEYPTRDISKEYYTVKSVTTGAIISDNAFDLVCRVLDAEMGTSFPDEALRAQAVAIYTYIRYCDANGMLPIVGVSSSYGSRIEEIVRSVEGQVCTYGGVPINALFCASTAGNTQGSEFVWSRSLPYLKPVISKYDYLDPNYGIKVSFTAAQMKSKIESITDIVLDPDDVENWFEITSRSYGKYVNGIKIGGRSSCLVNGTTRNLTAAVLRSSIIGGETLRSSAFDISYSNGIFTFTTYGYGHGVGMSQRGAQLLANKDGLKYDQILKYYYTGIAVECSGVNQAAEDRYGEEGDISGLEEASPSDGSINDIPEETEPSEEVEPSDGLGQQDADSDTAEQPEAPQEGEGAVTDTPESEDMPDDDQVDISEALGDDAA